MLHIPSGNKRTWQFHIPLSRSLRAPWEIMACYCLVTPCKHSIHPWRHGQTCPQPSWLVACLYLTSSVFCRGKHPMQSLLWNQFWECTSATYCWFHRSPASQVWWCFTRGVNKASCSVLVSLFCFISRDESPRNGGSEKRRVGKECRSRWSPYH